MSMVENKSFSHLFLNKTKVKHLVYKTVRYSEVNID